MNDRDYFPWVSGQPSPFPYISGDFGCGRWWEKMKWSVVRAKRVERLTRVSVGICNRGTALSDAPDDRHPLRLCLSVSGCAHSSQHHFLRTRCVRLSHWPWLRLHLCYHFLKVAVKTTPSGVNYLLSHHLSRVCKVVDTQNESYGNEMKNVFNLQAKLGLKVLSSPW